MITYKTPAELKKMKQGGIILKGVIEKMLDFVSPGMRTIEVDKLAEDYILSQGGSPSFKRVPGYHHTICICINEQVVHTPPSEQVIRDGDVVTIDCGVFYGGLNTDSAITIQVGKINAETTKFLKIGEETLKKALQQVKAGNKIGAISTVIDSEISGAGYCIINELTGHGVGPDLHEDPMIPGFAPKSIEATPTIREGMVLAVEVIYSKSSHNVKLEKGSKWSLISSDHSLSACFESTIAVYKNKTAILA